MDSLRRKKNTPTPSPQTHTAPKTSLASNYQKNAPSKNSTAKSHFYGKNISKNLFIKKNKPGFSFVKLIKNFFLAIFSLGLIVILVVGGFLVYKLNILSTSINNDSDAAKKPILETLSDISKITSAQRIPLKGESSERINILLLGIAGAGKPGGDLTDTIMIASIDTKNKKIALLSLPRDLYASVPESSYSAKINSLYKYGLSNNQDINPLQETIENITNLSINYYLVVNFSGFEKFIDDIGGINVDVQRDIYDPTYPGPNYSYETFELKKGFHSLDGATALKYARERHNDPEGDFGRAKRQQQVIQAAKNKIFSTQTLLNPFAVSKLIDTLGENVKTNLTLEEIDSLIKLTKNLDTQNINNAVVDAWKEDSLLKVSHIFYENTQAFILVPRVGNYTEVQELAKNIFNLKILEKRKEEIKNENPSIALINNTGNSATYSKIELLLKKKLGFENIKKLNPSIAIDRLKSDYSTTANTSIFDLTLGRKPFSLDELIKKIPTSLNTDNSYLSIAIKEDIINYDLVIILGEDLNDIYRYDEDSLEDLQKSEANEELGGAN
ncbi:MAG: hypothetical protein UR66_C0001G0121 [Candidatus Moranbacteria bacterium GW2011_GWE1_35_17]|nr:MAG: hypothetical protein UR66_C0001G0121 [Candidatus Moranbacteria bacterium GW2011_GWE1_35_17]KKP82774.1 MAG: hypothetical protein UR82_C0032G0005 [Candidatus Moranbacteria bacterium GW2011_GWF1_35_5]